MRAYDLASPPDAETLAALAELWRPYRTGACLYLWRSLSNAPVELPRSPSAKAVAGDRGQRKPRRR